MQGECFSPTLFSFFINDLGDRMNDIVEMGVTMNGTKISLLKYADDLVLISTWKDDTLSTENCKILYNMRFFRMNFGVRNRVVQETDP